MNSPPNKPSHVLLIATVGGTPEPLVASLRHWQPARIVFLPSRETRPLVEAVLASYAQLVGQPLSPGCYDLHVLPDPEDLEKCIESLRALDVRVDEWVRRGDQFSVVADFTAGTKCMTAALALQARRWPCLYSYIGGSHRSKEGVGIVQTGSERVVHSANPWDALGFQAVEDFITLFDHHVFVAAAAIVDRATRNAGSPSRKRELGALKVLAEAYDAWDRFEHETAKNKLNDIRKSRNDLTAILGSARTDRLLSRIDRHLGLLRQLGKAAVLDPALVLDLLANARRCHERGRHDDAVARLYRAIEAIAQVRLDQGYQIVTKSAPLERIPEPLRTERFSSKAKNGTVDLGLQDDYTLLEALGDELGAKFRALRLHDKRSPLGTRNQSILAHGYAPVAVAVYDQLWKAACELAGLKEDDIPEFPQLAAGP